MLPFDLHVLGLPLAFILSQDQTLRCKCKFEYLKIHHSLEFSKGTFVKFNSLPIFSKNFLSIDNPENQDKNSQSYKNISLFVFEREGKSTSFILTTKLFLKFF